jgi:predicted GNAT family acetyltransferase
MAKLDVRREEAGSKGRWLLEIDGHVAQMTYSRASPALIIIDHTDVPDALRGRGLARALVREAVETARREGFKIFPLCPAAKAILDKTPDWADVLKR